jgi:hypothetical protein
MIRLDHGLADTGSAFIVDTDTVRRLVPPRKPAYAPDLTG